ncbi:hypothetical protein AO242_02600 [Pseudomonas sp. ICMP 561]|nr:hypothetical protein AO242_02600 [Pseudomonas sp. ICMP 561]
MMQAWKSIGNTFEWAVACMTRRTHTRHNVITTTSVSPWIISTLSFSRMKRFLDELMQEVGAPQTF